MNYGFVPLNKNDVVSVNFDGDENFFSHPTFKVSDIIAKINESLTYGISDEEKEQLLGKGINCEVLKSGYEGWQKGRIRLNVEFYPDEPESPLDELRQQLEQIERSQ